MGASAAGAAAICAAGMGGVAVSFGFSRLHPANRAAPINAAIIKLVFTEHTS
jgi:hypothetical protein